MSRGRLPTNIVLHPTKPSRPTRVMLLLGGFAGEHGRYAPYPVRTVPL
jgi:hypothetical protein